MVKVISELEKGESVCIYGMPGVGRRYFTKQLEILLNEKKNLNKILYFEPACFENDPIKLIKDQLSVLVEPNKKSFLENLKEYTKNHKIIIIVGYLERVNNKRKFINFLVDIRLLHQTNIAVLTTCDYSIISSPDEFLFRSEHIADSFYRLELFDLRGTKRILVLLNDVYGWKVNLNLSGQIYRLSGGNASLIKYIAKAVDFFGEKIVYDFDQLTTYPPIKIRLEEFQQILLRQPMDVLLQMGLILDSGKPFSLLISKYFDNFKIEQLDTIYPGLTNLEKKILSFFIINKNKIINKDRIASWMKMSVDDYSLWAIYKTISRLKIKIKGNFTIFTVNGKGYILKDAMK